MDSAVEIREQQRKTQESVSATEKETAETAVWKTGDRWKSEERKENFRLKQMEDIFRQRRMMFLQTEKKESRNIAEKQ